MLAILFRWCVWSCGHNIVWLWCSHRSGHGLDHHTLATWYCAIAHLPPFELQSFYLSSLLSLCCCCCPCHHFVITIPFCCFVFISTLGNAVYSLHLSAYYCVHWERGLPILICFGSHYSVHWERRLSILVCFGSHYKCSGSCGVPSDILGWRMARWRSVPS